MGLKPSEEATGVVDLKSREQEVLGKWVLNRVQRTAA